MKPIDKFDWDNIEEGRKLLEYTSMLGDTFISAGGRVEYHPDDPYDVKGPDGWGTLRASSMYNEATGIFVDRYNDGKFSHSYDKYLKEELIQQFIEELEIDKDKFWFAVLFSLDFCNDICDNGMVLIDSCRDELTKLAKIIDDNISGWNSWQGAEFETPLTLILSNGKKKEDVVFENPTTLYYIAKAIKEKMESMKMERYITTDGFRFSDKTQELAPSIKISHFAQMLLTLFNSLPQVVAKRKKGAKHSQKETDLVCQLIYFTGLSLNKRWKDTENDYLKSFLRSYNVPYNVICTIYPTR